MSSEIEQAIDELVSRAVEAGDAQARGLGVMVHANAVFCAKDDLLALLAPEPEPSEREIKYVAETLYRDEFGYDASLIAAGDSDQLRYRHMARIALEAAARTARQTGGEA